MAKEEKADQRPGLFRRLARRVMTGGISPETLKFMFDALMLVLEFVVDRRRKKREAGLTSMPGTRPQGSVPQGSVPHVPRTRAEP